MMQCKSDKKSDIQEWKRYLTNLFLLATKYRWKKEDFESTKIM